MSGFSIALSGIDAAQKALETIGNNMANAATEGYHCQKVDLRPAYSAQTGGVQIGGGVNFEGVSRVIDNMLEQQILRQDSILEQLSQELKTMQTVEGSFGEFSESGGLNAAIDKFFNSLQDLCTHPAESIYQNQAVSSADAMAAQFRTLSSTLSTLQNQLKLETGNVVEQVNNLSSTIAGLNDNIERMEVVGAKANNLRDQRDQCIAELSKLVGVETYERDYGVVDVNMGNIPLVTGSTAVQLESGLNGAGELGIAIKGSFNYITDIEGGKLGGLLSLKNKLVAGVQNGLDDLAKAIISEVNQVHFQGVGSAGSFMELTGWTMSSDAVADFSAAGGPVTDGKIYIRVTDTATGEVTRHAIDVDASSDTLGTIAAKISAITGLSATADSSKLRITAKSGYTFDFLPAVLATPSSSSLTGAAPPAISVSGIYSGAANRTFTCTVAQSGSVGNGELTIEVRDGAGDVVNTINIGSGYAAGDKLDLADGIKIALSVGDLNAGDNFTIDAFANTDTSGLLAAVGINTLFSGKDASDIAVCDEIKELPSRIAVAAGAEKTDNANALKLSGIADKKVGELGGLTIGDFYRGLVSDVGQDISVKQIIYNGSEVVLKDLNTQQSNVSGVDVNDEAAQMLMYEQMFTAMSKYLNTVYSMLMSLMQMT
jgi:flagellar hook-associated protein 1 FlgK